MLISVAHYCAVPLAVKLFTFDSLSSYNHLQEEKEKLFTESRASFDEMVRSKDYEIKNLKDQLNEVRKDLETRGEVGTLYSVISVHT